MKHFHYIILVLVLVVATMLTACNTKTTSSTTSTQTQPVTSTVSTTTSNAQPANWWDRFGKPQYGGQITVSVNETPATFDPYAFGGVDSNYEYEPMFYPDWTLDRSIWSMQGLFVPAKYFVGNLAESWTQTDPKTVTVKLRKGITWQNKAPVNGREFTSDDVVFHYDRFLGTGHGYTQASPMRGILGDLEQVTANDKYTVVYHFKSASSGVSFFSLSDQAAVNWYEAPEWVALAGSGPIMDGSGTPLTDWKNAVGTGPWIMADFVSGASVTFDKNPAYWQNDPRYPSNKVPYADNLKLLVIGDAATRVAALRSAKIDMLGGSGVGAVDIDWQKAKTLENLGLNSKQMGVGYADGMIFRNDLKPFTDIRVRKALDMAVDRESMAKNLFGGTVPGTPTGLVTQAYKGWCYSYEDWPQTLKDEYAYNPQKAKELLSEAGYPDGFKTNVYTQGTFTNLLEVIKAYFKDINVDMTINVMDTTSFSNYVRTGKHDAMAESNAGTNWPPSRMIDQFYSQGVDHGTNGVNDPAYDEIRNKFWSSTTENEAAQAMVAADKESIVQHFGVFVVADPGYLYWQPYLKGYSGEVRFWSQQLMFSRLWIDQSQKK